MLQRKMTRGGHVGAAGLLKLGAKGGAGMLMATGSELACFAFSAFDLL